MATTCPHCGVSLADNGDAFCPDCRGARADDAYIPETTTPPSVWRRALQVVAVASSMTLVTGFICYYIGLFAWVLPGLSNAQRADEEKPSPAFMSSSKRINLEPAPKSTAAPSAK